MQVGGGHRESQSTMIVNGCEDSKHGDIDHDKTKNIDTKENHAMEGKNDNDKSKFGTTIKHKPNTDNLLSSINYNQKIYSETIVQELRKQNEELLHEVKALKLEKQQISLKLTPQSTFNAGTTLVYTPYSNSENLMG